MKPPRPFPVYPKRPLKQSGGAKIKVAQKSYWLGKHGSEESYREYERLRLAHAKDALKPKLPDDDCLTIDQLIANWLMQDPRGKDHAQVQRICRACTPLSRLFGSTRANEFRANRLRAVQDAMVDQRWMTDKEKTANGPWCRGYINRSVQRILIVFRWGESVELLPMGTTEHLRTVPVLSRTDKRVKDAPPRGPVDWKTQVEPCLHFMLPVVKAMVVVQFRAGLRPDEVCSMRRCEIDMDSAPDVWLYRPEKHKSEWRGHDLVKVLGPECQRVILPWLMVAEPDAFIFPPAKRRRGATHYQVGGYAQAITRAISKAGVAPWYPYQLRHAAGRVAEEAGGLAGAAAFLGHHSLGTTKIYTDRQRLSLAIETAKKIG